MSTRPYAEFIANQLLIWENQSQYVMDESDESSWVPEGLKAIVTNEAGEKVTAKRVDINSTKKNSGRIRRIS